MSGSSSEEKNLPPSAKKIRDARKRGQVLRAPDLVSAASAIAVLGFVVLGAPGIERSLLGALDAASAAAEEPFQAALGPLLQALRDAVLGAALPALLGGAGAAVLVCIAVTGGPVLSLDPLKPKLQTLDPIKGLGRMYGLKGWVELGKSLLKLVLLAGALGWITARAVRPLLLSGACGAPCAGMLLGKLVLPLMGAALGIYLVFGLVDLLLQRWLLRRELRMTRSEAKREHTDQEGNPHVRGEQRRQRSEVTRSAVAVGVARATVVIGGRQAAVALRYAHEEGDLPVVVARGKGEAAAALVQDARDRRIAVYWDDVLSAGLARRLRPGSKITSDFFQGVAQALYAAGAAR